MSDTREWNTDNVQNVCVTIGFLAASVAFCFAVERCHRVSIADEQNDAAETKAALDGCHDACAPGPVRRWSSSECICDK